MHFWMLGVIHEPCQSYARIALTKCFKLVSLMDDFCDNYSDTEEFEIFITSLERLGERSIISFIEQKLYIIHNLIFHLFYCDKLYIICFKWMIQWYRWDEQAAEKLPAYMKDLFIFTLNTINDIMEELKLRKNKHAEFVKELVSFSPKITPCKNDKDDTCLGYYV